MKFFFFSSLSALSLAFILALANILSGLELSQNQLASNEYHLLRALSILALSLGGSFGLIVFSQKCLDEVSKKRLRENPQAQLPKLGSRSNALTGSVVVILLSILSLISGTIANPGRLPLLHALLGFALCASFFVSLILWIQLSLELLKLDRRPES